MNLLFFDTETTGLIVPNEPLPRLVSIAWIVTDPTGNEIERCMFIRKPEDFVIDDEDISTKIHGITQGFAETKGKPFEFIIKKFEKSLKNVSTIIAHNLQFDRQILQGEIDRQINRLGVNLSLTNKKLVCTANLSSDLFGTRKRLRDLYYFYFEGVYNEHDALADTEACKLCYFAMKIVNDVQL